MEEAVDGNVQTKEEQVQILMSNKGFVSESVVNLSDRILTSMEIKVLFRGLNSPSYNTPHCGVQDAFFATIYQAITVQSSLLCK